jgi:hypothetical protein
MARRENLRILHLPESVGGNAYTLSNAMRRVGMDSQCWILKPNYLNYGFDRSIAAPGDGYLVTEVKRLLALRYVFQFDVIFFNFGSTLFRPLALRRRPGWSLKFYLGARAYMGYATAMQRLELWLLRLLGRRIFVQYQGDDARQGDYCLTHYAISPATEVDEHYYHPASDAHKRQQIRLFEQYCDCMYALNPDLLNVLPANAKFLPYTHIDLEEWTATSAAVASDRPLRIGHAPTHRGVKGTSYFLAALERLRQEGHDFELVLIENMSQSEAKAVYMTLDVVLDQLFVGWYGGLAVEAMALGKPVVVYIRTEDLRHIPVQMRTELPVVRTTAQTLESDLRDLMALSRKELIEVGRRSRAYVERWHDPETVARHLASEMLQA